MASNSEKIDAFFADMENEAPIEESFTIAGKTKTVWVRLIDAGERFQLNRGVKFQFSGKAGEPKSTTTSSETDLGESGERDAKLVMFAICSDATGTRMFDNIGQVKKRKGPVFDALLVLASKHNNKQGGEEEAGKDSKPTPSSASS